MIVWSPDAKLNHEEYLADFWFYYERLKGRFRKLEAGQSFSEPGNPSWEAFASGDWEGAMRLVQERAAETKEYFDGLQRANICAERLRLVSLPFSPYLVWELNVLLQNQKLGESIGVLHAEKAAQLVDNIWLDDFVILDEAVAYRVLYGVDGVNVGAERSCDPTIVGHLIAVFESLQKVAEPLEAFFEREVAHLRLGQ